MVASIGKIGSASHGVSYFEKDGYYAKDDALHREASAWYGRGAEAMGLSDPVEPEAFEKVLQGHVPDGRRLGRRERDGTVRHRPGVDVTLSAPKSVSLAALVGGDRRIVKAHDRAVKRTLDWIEKHAVQTRLRDAGTRVLRRVGNQKMVAATFTHDTSRNLDPQLHTHAVIANMVQGEDATWRTMADGGIFRGKMAIGAIYRAELARGLEGLGYSVEKSHADGRFEIAGVSREVIEAFSTRRAEIEAAMKARGVDAPAENTRMAQRVALYTRAQKRDVDKAALRKQWSRQAGELDFSARAVVSRARRTMAKTGDAHTQQDLFANPDYTATQAAEWAVRHLSERQSVFSHTALLTAVLGREPGAVTAESAEKAISELARDGGLHAARDLGHAKQWTTDGALARESETIALMRAGRNRGPRMMRRWVATTRLHRGRLNEGQKEAVRIALSSTDRVIGIQGYAGTGKTTMLKRFRDLSQRKGYKLKGLAPSASAAKTLREEAGIPTETLQRFLARNTGLIEGRATRKGLNGVRRKMNRTVLVVDEASLASTAQMRGLLKASTAMRLPRVVLVGDEKQLDGVDAGKPFGQLMKAGMQTAVLDEILRQKDATLKSAVQSTLEGEIKAAFKKLGDNVTEIERGKLAEEAAQRWVVLSHGERENCGVIAPTRALRDSINRIIRNELLAEGGIHGPARRGTKLISRGLTRAEAGLASSYAEGDTVIFNRRYKRLGVEKGDERTVAGIDRDRHAVILEDSKGRKVRWRPWEIAGKKGGVEAYRSGILELRAGDRVRFTRNDRDAGLVNGQMARVAGVEEDRVRFELEDGGTIALSEGHPSLRFLDHAWATTIHSFQGRTVDTIVAAMESGNRSLVNQKALYVAISRARYRAELITDDGRKLSDDLERASGERISALDAASDTAAVRAIFRDAGDGADLAKVAQAAGRYAREEIGPSPDRGAELERMPDRQIAEWGAELETVDQATPGTVREAGPDRAAPDPALKSPAPLAGNDRANEPVEMEMDLDMDM